MLQTLCKNIQRSRYENLIINLAIAYDGYNLDLPAFIDCRGRIYRCGVLHFHERDLARSLIVFADFKFKDNYIYEDITNTLKASAAFHFKSFVSVEEAIDWYDYNISQVFDNPFVYAREAKHPFQFLANILGVSDLRRFPICQDASASAYQIMSECWIKQLL